MPRFKDYYTFSKYNSVKVPADPVHLLHSIYTVDRLYIEVSLLNLVLVHSTFSAAALARALGFLAM